MTGPTKPAAWIDFDGTLTTNRVGFANDPAHVLDPPVPGAQAWIASLAPSFQIVICSGRASVPEGVFAIEAWLRDNDFPAVPITVTAEKPPDAVVGVDDRALRFLGTAYPNVDALLAFRPWWDTDDRDAKPPLPPVAGDTPDALAAVLRSRAEQDDFHVTLAVQRATAAARGRLAGMDARLKETGALAGKIALVKLERNVGDVEAAESISDALRYTLVCDPDLYAHAVNAALQVLDAAGLRLVRLRNYWTTDANPRYADGTYLGVNAVVECLDGLRVEVQFHTEQSYGAQQTNWALYRSLRTGSSTNAAATVEAMRVNNSLVQPPPYLDTLTADASRPRELTPEHPAGHIPAQVNYREAAEPAISCASCAFFTNGYCSMFDATVGPSMLCDEWRPIESDQSILAAAPPLKPQKARHLNAHIKAGMRRADAKEADLIKQVKAILDAAADTAARNFLTHATDHLSAAGTPEAQWSAPAQNEVLDVDGLVQTLRTKTDPVRLATIQDTMGPTLAGSGLDFDITNPLAGKVLAQSGSQITNIAATTRLNAMRVIRASHEQGLSIPDTAKAIRAGMKEANTARATLIARTELVGVTNGASLAATQIVADATGSSFVKTWLTSPGAQFPRHEDYDGLDNQQRALDETFQVGEDELQFPGDPDGDPGEVCNCRCTMVYDDGQGEQEVGADDGGIDATQPAVAENDATAVAPDEGADVADETDVAEPAPPAPVEEPVQALAVPVTPESQQAIAAKSPPRSTDPYLAGLQKERDSAYGKYQRLNKKERETPDSFTADDRTKRDALKMYHDDLKALADKGGTVTDERAYLARRLQEKLDIGADSPASLEHAKLLQGRLAALDKLPGAEPAAVTPPVVPAAVTPVTGTSEFARDIQAIRDRAEWITPREAQRKIGEMLDQGRQPTTEERRRYAGGGIAAQVPGYLQEQFQATLDAGKRVEEEVNKTFGAAQAQKQDDLEYRLLELDEAREARIAPLEDAYRKAEQKQLGFFDEARNEIAQRDYGMPFDSLSPSEKLDVSRIIGRSLPADLAARKRALDDARFAADKAVVKERSAWLAEKKAVEKELAALKSGNSRTERDALVQVLTQLRAMGPGDGVDITTFGKDAGYTKATKALDTATPFYPREWINDMPLMSPGTHATRGYHQVVGKSKSGRVMSKIVLSDRRVVVQGDLPSTSVAVHELGHAVESTRPDIVAAEKAFYEWRTRGGSFSGPQEPLVKMSTLRPGWGYRSEEVAREDKFSEPYMGKEYNGDFYELLTMGMEGLFSGTEVLDAEYKHWLLGLLALA